MKQCNSCASRRALTCNRHVMKFVAVSFVILDMLREMRVLLAILKIGADSAILEEDSVDIFEGRNLERNLGFKKKRTRDLG